MKLEAYIEKLKGLVAKIEQAMKNGLPNEKGSPYLAGQTVAYLHVADDLRQMLATPAAPPQTADGVEIKEGLIVFYLTALSASGLDWMTAWATVQEIEGGFLKVLTSLGAFAWVKLAEQPLFSSKEAAKAEVARRKQAKRQVQP